MKYSYYEIGKSIPHINTFTDGSHILVVRNVVDYIDTAIFLENSGWEIRDCVKILLKDKTLQVGLLRKPFKGTVANNVLKNGCGGLNIDSCRISHTDPEIVRKTFDSPLGIFTNPNRRGERGAGPSPDGRFPANLLLECTCEEVIEGKSDGVVINNKNSQSINDTIYKLGHSKGEQEAPRAYKDTGATHMDSNCPCKKLNTQSGITKSTGGRAYQNTNDMFSGGYTQVKGVKKDPGFGDKGGASRFFFNFTSAEQMKEYLTNLIKV